MPDTVVPEDRDRAIRSAAFFPRRTGRDPERTPMPWTGGAGGGFTAAGRRAVAARSATSRRATSTTSATIPTRCSRCAATSSACATRSPSCAGARTPRRTASTTRLWAWRRGERTLVALNLADDAERRRGRAREVADRDPACPRRRAREGELALGPWEGCGRVARRSRTGDRRPADPLRPERRPLDRLPGDRRRTDGRGAALPAGSPTSTSAGSSRCSRDYISARRRTPAFAHLRQAGERTVGPGVDACRRSRSAWTTSLAVMDDAGMERAASSGHPMAAGLRSCSPRPTRSATRAGPRRRLRTVLRHQTTRSGPTSSVTRFRERDRRRDWGRRGSMLVSRRPWRRRASPRWCGAYERLVASPGGGLAVDPAERTRSTSATCCRRSAFPTLVLHRATRSAVALEHGRYLGRAHPRRDTSSCPGRPLPWPRRRRRVLDEIEEFLTGARHGAEPRPRAGDRAVHRHRRLDRARRRARRPPAGASCSTTTTGSCAASSTRSGGREVKTTGDGFLATFDGPARAIRCADGDPRRPSARSASRSAPACTPASARCAATTSAGSPCTSARGSARSPGPARCSCRARSRISSPARASRSTTAGRTRSRASPTSGGSTRSRAEPGTARSSTTEAWSRPRAGCRPRTRLRARPPRARRWPGPTPRCGGSRAGRTRSTTTMQRRGDREPGQRS